MKYLNAFLGNIPSVNPMDTGPIVPTKPAKPPIEGENTSTVWAHSTDETRETPASTKHWRWQVANWPWADWLAWHHRIDEIISHRTGETPYAMQERAYRELLESR